MEREDSVCVCVCVCVCEIGRMYMHREGRYVNEWEDAGGHVL